MLTAVAPPVRCPQSVGRVRYTHAAALAVVAVVAFNLLYTALLCPLDLAPDEAHYWDWSRRLDWSYSSKGPLVAWLIRGSCELFGTSAVAVRLPAVLCGGLLLAGMARLAANTFRDERFAFGVTLLAVTLPPFSAASVLMTIDPPLLACWAWAAVAVQRQRWRTAGVLVAVGTLAKLTMLLFPACVGLMLLFHRERRTRLAIPFVPLSALGLIPLLVWNAAHDWVSVRHLLGHADNGGEVAAWYSPLAFVGGQFAVLLGFWFVAWAAGVWKFRPTADSETAVLWWLSVPVFAVFVVASVRTTGQPNWPAVAYVTGFVLAVRWAWDRVGRKWLIAFALLGLALTVCLRWPNAARPLLAQLLPKPTATNATPIRKLDPTARLSGWRHLATEVDRIRLEEKQRTGEETLLAAMVWTVPGELGFYCDGHPTVYSFGAALADRFSQYDVWRPNPVADAQVFAGRTFVYVGEVLPDGVFDSCEVATVLTHEENGVPLATWTIWVCRGYRGFDRTPRLSPPRY